MSTNQTDTPAYGSAIPSASMTGVFYFTKSMINVYLLIEPFSLVDQFKTEHIPSVHDHYNIEKYIHGIVDAWCIPENIAKRLGTVFTVDRVLWESESEVTVVLSPLDYLDEYKTANAWTRLEWEDWYTKRAEGNQ